jgi:hypothetical protein
VDSVLENNYIFEIDCLQTIKGLGGREVLISKALNISILSDFSFVLRTCLCGEFNFYRGGHKM